MNRLKSWFALSLVVVLGGCATMPSGPSFMALPGTGKDLSQFRANDNQCRLYASQLVGGPASDPGVAESSRLYGYAAQRRYDESYIQCMYSSGHKVPLPGSMARSMMQAPAIQSPDAGPGVSIPPPPPNMPPTSTPPPDYVPPPASR